MLIIDEITGGLRLLPRKGRRDFLRQLAFGDVTVEEKVSGTVFVDFGSTTGIDCDFQAQSFDHFVTPGIRTVRRTPFDTVSECV